MPHFKDSDGRVYWLGADDTPRDGLTQITDNQAAALMRPPVADRKALLWNDAKVRRDAAIDAGVPVAGIGTFDSDPASRANITGAVTMALIAQSAGSPFSIGWKLADNSVVTLNAAQMIAAGLAVGQRVAACHAHAQSLGIAINAASSHAALDAIDVSAGW